MRLLRGFAVGLAGIGLAVAGGCSAHEATSTSDEPATRSTSTAPPTSTASVTFTYAGTTSTAATSSTQQQATTETAGTSTAPATTAATTTTLAPPAATVSGAWAGTWSAQDGTGGALHIAWTQQGNELHGALAMEGAPCVDGGVINGTIAGRRLAFAVNNRGEAVQLAGGVQDGKLAGTFACDAARGAWEARAATG